MRELYNLLKRRNERGSFCFGRNEGRGWVGRGDACGGLQRGGWEVCDVN